MIVMCTTLQHESQELESELYVEPLEAIGSPSHVHTSKDLYCFVCHKDRINIHCKRCPRSYHLKCIPANTSSISATNNNNKTSKTCAYDSWLCCECQEIMKAESEEPSECLAHRLSQMTVDELSQLLKFALTTIRHSADPTFHKPVLPIVFPDYHQLVLYPMDLQTIENNITAKKYKSQMSFLADIKWIVHNCIIYNHSNHPLTTNAKYLSRVAKNEMAEMEICPDCFKNFYTVTDTSFAEPCRKPHQLVYARVKGYPLWPAKVVRLGKQNDVDCRFFGTHDRAWVAVDSCWLLSEAHPGTKPSKTHKSKFEGAMRELAVHVDRLKEKFPGKFKYSPQKTQFSPNKLFVCDEDNIEHENFLSKINNNNSNNNNNNNNNTESNDANNSNSSNADNNVSIASNLSKNVTPGVFSLTSDKVLDELKSELKITNINSDLSSNLTNKSKLSQQMKDELSAKTRTARVGKRNVAEALRANKMQRTSTSSSSSALSHAPHSRSSQSSSSNCSPNNSHSPAISSTSLSLTPVKVRVTATSPTVVSAPDVVNEEVEKLRKQLIFDNAMHKEEIREIKHNADLVLMEMRQSWITEKDKALEDERQKSELDKKLLIAQFEMEKKKLVAQIESAKRKQWCAECLKEAQLFCCYDTWYCSYECQKNHWSNHVNHCQQIHKKS